VENDTLVAVDIAKEVFEVAVSDRPGRVALRKRLRDRFTAFFGTAATGSTPDGGPRHGALLPPTDHTAQTRPQEHAEDDE